MAQTRYRRLENHLTQLIRAWRDTCYFLGASQSSRPASQGRNERSWRDEDYDSESPTIPRRHH